MRYRDNSRENLSSNCSHLISLFKATINIQYINSNNFVNTLLFNFPYWFYNKYKNDKFLNFFFLHHSSFLGNAINFKINNCYTCTYVNLINSHIWYCWLEKSNFRYFGPGFPWSHHFTSIGWRLALQRYQSSRMIYVILNQNVYWIWIRKGEVSIFTFNWSYK